MENEEGNNDFAGGSLSQDTTGNFTNVSDHIQETKVNSI